MDDFQDRFSASEVLPKVSLEQINLYGVNQLDEGHIAQVENIAIQNLQGQEVLEQMKAKPAAFQFTVDGAREKVLEVITPQGVALKPLEDDYQG